MSCVSDSVGDMAFYYCHLSKLSTSIIHCRAIMVFDFGSGSLEEIHDAFRSTKTVFGIVAVLRQMD
jgi:hypothetical protein